MPKGIRINPTTGLYLEDMPDYAGPQTAEIILKLPPEGRFLHKWDAARSEWVEGLSAAEIAAKQALVIDPVVTKLATIKGKTVITLTTAERTTLIDAIAQRVGLTDGTKIL